MHSQRLLLATLLTASWVQDGASPGTPRMKGRWLVVLLAIGVALDLMVGLALGYVAIQARNASSQAHILKVAAYEACLSNNDNKAADADRWRKVLALVDTMPHNQAVQVFIAGVNAANAAADAPRDCQALVP